MIVFAGASGNTATNIPGVAFYGQSTGLTANYISGIGTTTCTMTWNENKLSWYSSSNGNEETQRNKSGDKYYWLAIA